MIFGISYLKCYLTHISKNKYEPKPKAWLLGAFTANRLGIALHLYRHAIISPYLSLFPQPHPPNLLFRSAMVA